MFKLMPHGKVSEYLKDKLKDVGIKLKLIDEIYAFQTDSCDKRTTVSKKGKGWGRMIKRGLFLSPVKWLLNADVNEARNILRKFKNDGLPF